MSDSEENKSAKEGNSKSDKKTEKEDTKMEEENEAENSESEGNDDPTNEDASPSQNTKEETKKAWVNKVNMVAKKKRDDKKVMMDDDEAKKAIAEYMEAKNRPFSVQNLIDNHSGRIKKNQTQKIWDELWEDKILIVKEYGKTKIYMINQDIFPDASTEDLDRLDEQISVMKGEWEDLKNQLKELTVEVKRITSEPTNKELDDEIAKLEKEDKNLAKKLKEFEKKRKNAISEEDIKKIEITMQNYEQEWKKRKRGWMEMVDTITENLDKNRKDFMEEIGIETDEANNSLWPT